MVSTKGNISEKEDLPLPLLAIELVRQQLFMNMGLTLRL